MDIEEYLAWHIMALLFFLTFLLFSAKFSLYSIGI